MSSRVRRSAILVAHVAKEAVSLALRDERLPVASEKTTGPIASSISLIHEPLQAWHTGLTHKSNGV